MACCMLSSLILQMPVKVASTATVTATAGFRRECLFRSPGSSEFPVLTASMSMSSGWRRESHAGLFFTLPLGNTVVVGGAGRSDVDSRGGEVSFFGFFAILLL